MSRWSRTLLSALFAYLAGFVGFLVLFGNPISQRIIYSMDFGQSAKLIDVWNSIPPIPPVSPFWDRVTSLSAEAVPVLVLLYLWVVGLVWIYSRIAPAIAGTGWRKGLWFGAGIWISAFIFFETFTPLNLFGEPLHLIAYELLLEVVIAGLIGVTIAATYHLEPAS